MTPQRRTNYYPFSVCLIMAATNRESEEHLQQLRGLLKSYENLQGMIRNALSEHSDDGGGETEPKVDSMIR
jgi:hypothetical protein